MRDGVDVRFNQRVAAFETTDADSRCTGVTLEDGAVVGAGVAVVNAAGPWFNKLNATVGLELSTTALPTRIQVRGGQITRRRLTLPVRLHNPNYTHPTPADDSHTSPLRLTTPPAAHAQRARATANSSAPPFARARKQVGHKYIPDEYCSLPFVADGWGPSGIYFMPRAKNNQLVFGSVAHRFESEIVDPDDYNTSLDPDVSPTNERMNEAARPFVLRRSGATERTNPSTSRPFLCSHETRCCRSLLVAAGVRR